MRLAASACAASKTTPRTRRRASPVRTRAPEVLVRRAASDAPRLLDRVRDGVRAALRLARLRHGSNAFVVRLAPDALFWFGEPLRRSVSVAALRELEQSSRTNAPQDLSLGARYCCDFGGKLRRLTPPNDSCIQTTCIWLCGPASSSGRRPHQKKAQFSDVSRQLQSSTRPSDAWESHQQLPAGFCSASAVQGAADDAAPRDDPKVHP